MAQIKAKHGKNAYSQQLPDEALQFVKRSVYIKGTDTTISLERFYWDAIDGIARSRGNVRLWRDTVTRALDLKPTNYRSRAGWLRIYVAGFAHAFLPRPLKREVDEMYMPSWSWGRLLRDKAKILFSQEFPRERWVPRPATKRR